MGLTMLRLLLLPVFLWLLLLGAGPGAGGVPRDNPHRWSAMIVFAIMAITDKLDGWLARKFNQASRLGALLDPIADKLLVASSLVVLSSRWIASPGYQIPVWVVAAVYLKDVTIALGFILLVYLLGSLTVRPRPLGKLGTFLQLVLVIVTLIGPDLAKLSAPSTHGVLGVLQWSVFAVAVLSCIDYVLAGVRLFRESRGRAPASE